jgi:hypothetical protein
VIVELVVNVQAFESVTVAVITPMGSPVAVAVPPEVAVTVVLLLNTTV